MIVHSVLGVLAAVVVGHAPEVAVGEKAPEFTLRDAAGASRSLAEFRGKKAVALVFYPAMFRRGG